MGAVHPCVVRLTPCRLAAIVRNTRCGGEAGVAVVRVLVVDDQELSLRAMAAVVGETPGFEVVGLAATGERAVELAATLLPDLVLMDVNLPGIDGLEATRRVLKALPGLVVLLVSTYDEETGASFVVESGAAGYVTKAAFEPDRLEVAWSGS
jgi:two-component system, NarL family, invasion response regulator UvrY